MYYVTSSLGYESVDIAKQYRKRGLLKDAIRCACEDEESNKDFIADCILAEVRVSLCNYEVNVDLDITKREKQFSYDSIKEVEISELDVPFVMHTSLKGHVKIGHAINQEHCEKTSSDLLNIEIRKLLKVISMYRINKNSQTCAKAHQLLGVINNDPQMVITGMNIFKDCKCDIGVIKSIHLLMSCKPEPYQLTVKKCKIVANSLDKLCEFLRALVQPTLKMFHKHVKNCLDYYLVDKEISASMPNKYFLLIKEGTRINLPADECYSQSKIHEYIALDLLKIASEWSSSVKNVINTEFEKFLKCFCKSGQKSFKSSLSLNDYTNHLPTENLMASLCNMIKMAGSLFKTCSDFEHLLKCKNMPIFLPLLLKELKTIQETCHVLYWADSFFEMLFPSFCFSYNIKKHFELLHAIRSDAFAVGINFACNEFDKNFSEVGNGKLTDLLLKMFLLSTIADSRLKNFREFLKEKEVAIMQKMNKSKNSKKSLTRGFLISKNQNTGEVTQVKSYFRFLADAFSTICTDPVETIQSLDGFICYIIFHPYLVPKFSNFALISEFHVAIIAIILLNNFQEKCAILPLSYIALLDFFDLNAKFPKNITFSQSIANSTILPHKINTIQKIAVKFIDILFGKYAKCKNVSILGNAMQVKNDQFSEDQMERLLILALVLLINCINDGILGLQSQRLCLMLKFFKEKVKNLLKQILPIKNDSAEIKPSEVNSSVNNGHKFSDKMIRTLKSLDCMKSRIEAVQILQNLLFNRNKEYLCFCKYSLKSRIIELNSSFSVEQLRDIDYVRFERLQNENLNLYTHIDPSLPCVEDDDIEKRLLAINQTDKMSADVLFSPENSDTIILLNYENLDAAKLVPFLQITELKCCICGKDFFKSSSEIELWSDEGLQTNQLITGEINIDRFEKHKRSLSHETTVENYKLFSSYCNSEVSDKLHDVDKFKEELRKIYSTDKNLAQIVQEQLFCIKKCEHEIMDFITKSIESYSWHKLDNLYKITQNLEHVCLSVKNKVKEAELTALEVIGKMNLTYISA